jgi:hypothetical protein
MFSGFGGKTKKKINDMTIPRKAENKGFQKLGRNPMPQQKSRIKTTPNTNPDRWFLES